MPLVICPKCRQALQVQDEARNVEQIAFALFTSRIHTMDRTPVTSAEARTLACEAFNLAEEFIEYAQAVREDKRGDKHIHA